MAMSQILLKPVDDTSPPTVTSFTPIGQRSGGTIVLTGTNFTGASAVKIGGTSVTSFTVDSATQITATIDATIRSGTVAVTTSSGTGTSSSTAYCLGTPSAWFKGATGLWQDTGGTTPASADADPVGRWDDNSGNSNNVTQGTSSAKPTVKLAVKNSQNVVRSDGVNDTIKFTGTGLDILKGVGGASLFAATNPISGTGESHLIGFDTSTTGSTRFALVFNRTAARDLNIVLRRLDADSPTVVTQTNGITVGTWLIAGVVADFTNNLSTIYNNGTSVATGTTGGAGSVSNTSSGAASGLLGANSSFGVSSDIGEALVYASALTGANVTVITNYLNAILAIF